MPRAATGSLFWILALALVGCAGPRKAAREPGRELFPPYGSGELGPGFDIVWLGSPGEVRHVELGWEQAFLVDGSRETFVGPSLTELAPMGLRVMGAVLSAQRDRVYSIQDGAFFRQRVGGPRERLWKAPWEIDRIVEDRAAFYAVLIDCRKCVPKQREQIWRIPKAAGPASLLYEAEGELVTRLESDERALYARVFRFRNSEWVNLRLSIDATSTDRASRGAGRVTEVERLPSVVDWDALGVSPPNEEPVGVDDADLVFEVGTELYALARDGTRPRLLASLDGDEPRACFYCGSSRQMVCMACEDVVYQIPKEPRPRGKIVAHDAGDPLAVTDGALFWADGSSLVRRRRDESCDMYDDECNAVVAELPSNEEVVSLLADGEFLYARLYDQSLWRVEQDGGRVELFEAAPGDSAAAPDSRPLSRSLATDAEAVYWVDSVQGAVVRREKSSGERRALGAKLTLPRALALRGSSVFVLASSDDATGSRDQFRGALSEIDVETGAIVRKVELPPGGPSDLVATRHFVYVSFEEGGLVRLGAGDSQPTPVFPVAHYQGHGMPYSGPALRVSTLGATLDSLFFTADAQVLRLDDSARFPTVLVSGLYGGPRSLAPAANALFFAHLHRHKWEERIDVGVVGL